jgi:hypothetical protein
MRRSKKTIADKREPSPAESGLSPSFFEMHLRALCRILVGKGGYQPLKWFELGD